MNCIYTPKGRAREYSPKALNVYLNCTHSCQYCYCCKLRGSNFFGKPSPRAGLVESLRKQLEKETISEQVLFSFVGDIYCETSDNGQTARECLELLAENRVPVAVLTKGGTNALRDLDVFKKFGEHIQVGATLTFDNDADSLSMEPGAALPDDRLQMLSTLKENGVRTFASFEPVINPSQSLNLIQKSLDFVDVYKIGKINNFRGIDKQIDWTSFLSDAVSILRDAKKPFYVKEDLRRAAPSVKLYGNECIADEFNVK